MKTAYTIRVSAIYNGPYSGGWGSCGFFNQVVILDEAGIPVLNKTETAVYRTHIECLERYDVNMKNKSGPSGGYIQIPDLKEIELQIKKYQKIFPDAKVEWEFIPDRDRYLSFPRFEPIRQFAVIKVENPLGIIVEKFFTEEEAKSDAANRGKKYKIVRLHGSDGHLHNMIHLDNYPNWENSNLELVP